MAQAIVWSALAGVTGIMVAFLLSVMLFSVIRLFLDGTKRPQQVSCEIPAWGASYWHGFLSWAPLLPS
ncbi:MAG: hypothetical protein U1U88_000304 [Lawsonella clevelandensis]